MNPQNREKSSLHYLVQDKDDYGVAHCLDLDLVATAKKGIEEAIRRLDILVRCQCQIPFGSAENQKAPGEYWNQFSRGVHYEDRTLDFGNPSVEIIAPTGWKHLRVEAKRAA